MVRYLLKKRKNIMRIEFQKNLSTFLPVLIVSSISSGLLHPQEREKHQNLLLEMLDSASLSIQLL